MSVAEAGSVLRRFRNSTELILGYVKIERHRARANSAVAWRRAYKNGDSLAILSTKNY